MKKLLLAIAVLIMMPLANQAQENVTVEVNIAEFAFILTDDFPQYKSKKEVRDYIQTRLFDTAKERGFSVGLLKRMVFRCKERTGDSYTFSYINTNGNIPIVSYVIGKLKAGQKVEVGKEYIIVGGVAAFEPTKDYFGIEDDLSSLCAGMFAFRDVEVEPAE